MGPGIHCYRYICGIIKKKGIIYIYWNAYLYSSNISLESTYAGEALVLRRMRASDADFRERIVQPSAISSSRVILRGSSSRGFWRSSSSSSACRICSLILSLRVVSILVGIEDPSVILAFVHGDAFFKVVPREGKLSALRSIFCDTVSVRRFGGRYFCPGATAEEPDTRLPMRIGSSLITGFAILVRDRVTILMQANGSILCYNKTKNRVILSFLFSYRFMHRQLSK
jgi:hypothetical protein